MSHSSAPPGPAAGPPRLELRDVAKSFAPSGPKSPRGQTASPTVALSGVSLCLRRGERVAVIGRSGCGKSTLVRVAAGLLRPDSGQVLADGLEVVAPGEQVAIVFQEPRLLPWLSVGGNLRLGTRAQGARIPRSAIAPEVALDLVDLPRQVTSAWPSDLSGGMAQRVSLARALTMGASLMLLDEALGALDVSTRMLLQRRLAAHWSADGTAVLAVTHDLDEAVYLADRVLVLGYAGSRTVEVDIGLPRAPDRDRDSAQYAHCLAELRSLIAHEPHALQGGN